MIWLKNIFFDWYCYGKWSCRRFIAADHSD